MGRSILGFDGFCLHAAMEHLNWWRCERHWLLLSGAVQGWRHIPRPFRLDMLQLTGWRGGGERGGSWAVDTAQRQRQLAKFGCYIDLLGLVGGDFQRNRAAKVAIGRIGSCPSTLRIRRIDSQHTKVLDNRFTDRSTGQGHVLQILGTVILEILRQDDVDMIAWRQ